MNTSQSKTMEVVDLFIAIAITLGSSDKDVKEGSL
jgi:hypothetical protein